MAATLEFLKPLLVRMAVGFLSDKNVSEKLKQRVREKIRRQSQTSIGKKMGMKPGSDIGELPVTSYEFYMPFFKDPHEGDFIYPLKDYVRSHTSGTMGKPKIYLLPTGGLKTLLRKTGATLFLVSTFDGHKYNFRFGDTLYINVPGGSFISNIASNVMTSSGSGLIRIVPENRANMSFQEKIDYFVDHYREIDMAQMTVTTLLDDVRPRIDGRVNLKAFISLDSSAGPMKEEIRDFVGVYPMTPYASTESMVCTLPSVEHPGCFFFDWRVIYPEFVPEEKALDYNAAAYGDTPEVVPLSKVEVGKRYQLIITPFYNDLTRYVTSDVLQCVSLGDGVLGVNTPVFSFYSRADKLVSLHNFTRINEQEIMAALQSVEVPFVEFTVRKELDGTKEFMVLYLELSREEGAEAIRARVHEELMKVDKDWRDLTTMMNYTPLRIRLLPRGSFKRFLSRREGMPRITHIDMKDDQFRELIEG
jgi:hypothetical protein